MADTFTINGSTYTLAELEQLTGATNLQPPLSPEQVAALSAQLDAINRERSPLSDLLGALALLALGSGRQSGTVYSVRDGAYYRNGTRLSDLQMRQLITQHQARTAVLMDSWATDLINDRITLEEWGQRMAGRIVDDHLRMAQLGAGTRAGLSNRIMGNLYPRLVDGMPDGGISELDALSKFMDAISSGNVSEAGLRARARQYAVNSRASYEEARHSRLLGSGDWEGMRLLDPGARHCADCPGYATPGWVPLAQIVPVGSRCQCRGRCRCRVMVRRVNLSSPLPA